MKNEGVIIESGIWRWMTTSASEPIGAQSSLSSCCFYFHLRFGTANILCSLGWTQTALGPPLDCEVRFRLAGAKLEWI